MSKKPPRTPPMPLPGSKIGYVSTNRTIAQATAPGSTPATSQSRSFVDTYFTKVPVEGEAPEIIYNGDRVWVKVILTLETAGPVAVGNLSSITPVLSGKGMLLETDEPAEFFIAQGTRLYVAATGINRIKRVIEPLPWLETISGMISQLLGAGGIAPAIANLGSKL